MLKKLLVLLILSSGLSACASWFSNNDEKTSPEITRADNDMLFSDNASAPIHEKSNTSAAIKNASAPVLLVNPIGTKTSAN
jgi:hypothetical protein